MSLNQSITHGKEHRKPYRGAKGIKMSNYKISAITFLLFILINHLFQMTKFKNKTVKDIMNGIALIAIYAVAFCLSELN